MGSWLSTMLAKFVRFADVVSDSAVDSMGVCSDADAVGSKEESRGSKSMSMSMAMTLFLCVGTMFVSTRGVRLARCWSEGDEGENEEEEEDAGKGIGVLQE